MSRLGLPWVHHRTTDSTNARASALAREGAPHGTLVTADEQTAGRGRHGRAWVAERGTAVLMSLVIRGLEERHAMLPLGAAVAVCEAAEACAPVRCMIKWPNDVWVDGKKLAGILVEGRPQEGWAVVGLGINVTSGSADFPEDLRETATSLTLESPAGGQPSREAVRLALLAALTPRVGQDRQRILADWRSRDALRGRRIAWSGGAGTADGVDDRGALLVDTGGERVSLDAGEVHLQVDV